MRKITLLDITSCLVPRPLKLDSTTAAALFRTIELARPVVLCDEYDAYGAENEELRGIVNAGHRRDGEVLRTVGDDHEPRMFHVYAPMALAAIKGVPGTIEDRSIVVKMRRRRRGEKIDRFRSDRADTLVLLARCAATWGIENRAQLAAADPEVPPGLFNRSADNWRPLLAVADACGGDLPERARAVAERLAAAAAAADDTSRGVALLADIRNAFVVRKVDRLPSKDLVAYLIGLEDRPWGENSHGRPISASGVARLLKPFAIRPGTIRLDDGTTPKGYRLAQFVESFESYLPPTPHVSSSEAGPAGHGVGAPETTSDDEPGDG